MSEPIPESIPTSADSRSQRPVKKARVANTALAAQASAIDHLFLDPERPLNIPATSSAAKSSLPPPPEIVANVQGSSAGAGSGEFHVYKASRRREYERLRTMDEEAKKEDEDSKWEEEERKRRERDEEKTRKNREKRNKKKSKKGEPGTVKSNGASAENGEPKSNVIKKPLAIPRRDGIDNSEADAADTAETTTETGVTILEDD